MFLNRGRFSGKRPRVRRCSVEQSHHTVEQAAHEASGAAHLDSRIEATRISYWGTAALCPSHPRINRSPYAFGPKPAMH